MKLLCGISDGRGRRCGKSLIPLDGKLNGPDGTKWTIVQCRKHGGLVARDADLNAAYRRAQSAFHFATVRDRSPEDLVLTWVGLRTIVIDKTGF